MDRSLIKVDRLRSIYEKGDLEFLEYSKQNLPDNDGIFYCPCIICGNINIGTRKKYFITYVVMVYVKIIQYGRGMVKWIKSETGYHKFTKLMNMKIWMVD
ncbi:hypothetical protein KIW84_054239 [Lathyrus oleraceus]|uniref:Transposase-associated domain-containing protein n=1 Tax=Pisum sativum TaxID=3888 RepID=A0A9D5AHX7_PEA|nr:hypothetical protein KIW84_054239 [Pisum sativum]